MSRAGERALPALFGPMLLPTLPFWLWVAFCWARGTLRWDELAVAAGATALAQINARTRRLLIGVVPIALVGLLYDAMRLVQNVGLRVDNVHVCDLRAAEMRWFGMDVGGVRGTVHDYLQLHALPALDVLCAIPYGTFIFVVAAYSIYLYFKDYPSLLRFTWGFLLLNIAGFVTYHLYPAAPPWYFHSHGCHVDLSVHASEGPNLARVDAWLGIPYFAGFYGRSSDVFGAVPSLHVAYPLALAIAGFRHHKLFGRAALTLFYLSMCFAAVYLDHHWIIDVIVGSLYAVAAALVMQRVMPMLSWRLAPARERVTE